LAEAFANIDPLQSACFDTCPRSVIVSQAAAAAK